MQFAKKILLTITSISAAAIMLSACSTSKVVQTTQVGDEALSCSALQQKIEEARSFERQAQGKKGVTGENVAAAVLFWPALLVTYSSAEEAEDAARERQTRLVNIANRKGCQAY